jgi:ornithine cyclodeaminase/alanine dehydrogenase
MKLITFNDIENAGISPTTCMAWTADAIAHKKEAILPAKISLHPGREGVFCNFMPSIVKLGNGRSYGGMKVVTRYPDREPALSSTLLLFNAETGEDLAFMDADWITAMRTGAVAAHSIKLLAKKDFSTLGIMGLGNTGRATMLMVAESTRGRHLIVKTLRHHGQEAGFAERFSAYPDLEFIFVDTYKELIRGTDVIVSCVTYLADDIAQDDWFEEGVLVVPVHTRGFTNCDLFFDKVYADDTAHVHGFKNFDRFRHFAEVSGIVCGTDPGRESDMQRILAYNIGLSIHDVTFAAHLYDTIDLSRCADIDLGQPETKFWV